MSRIQIRHTHSQTPAQARANIEDIAEQMAEKFELACRWEGDRLHFQRSGVDGYIHLVDQAVEVDARLNFMLAMLRPTIEAEIIRQLETHFA